MASARASISALMEDSLTHAPEKQRAAAYGPALTVMAFDLKPIPTKWKPAGQRSAGQINILEPPLRFHRRVGAI